MTAGPSPNPYQPPSALGGDLDLAAPIAVTFQLDARLRRHAIDHYLLHWHLRRLLFSSLAMIFVSSACFFAAQQVGMTAFIPTFMLVMFGSAAIYTALVRRTKNRIGDRLEDIGLGSNEPMTLESDIHQLRFISPEGTHVWPNDKLRIHRTSRGLLICPEPLLFVFVPKKGAFDTESYRQFFEVIKSRTSPQEESSPT